MHINKLWFLISMKILCFGNEYVKGDDLALKLADSLNISGVEFVKCQSLQDLEQVNDDVAIIDTVIGINKVEVINNIDDLELGKMYSLHDFDLGFHLKLMKELGKIKSVKIIGVPSSMDFEDVKNSITNLLSKKQGI